jgi:hypothetical protein
MAELNRPKDAVPRKVIFSCSMQHLLQWIALRFDVSWCGARVYIIIVCGVTTILRAPGGILV